MRVGYDDSACQRVGMRKEERAPSTEDCIYALEGPCLSNLPFAKTSAVLADGLMNVSASQALCKRSIKDLTITLPRCVCLGSFLLV